MRKSSLDEEEKSEPVRASAEILSRRPAIAAALIDRAFARHPEREDRHGAVDREKSGKDANDHLLYLAQALALDNVGVFRDYVAWAKVLLAQRGVLVTDLAFQLNCMAEVLKEKLPPKAGALAVAMVEEAVAALPSMPEDLPTFLNDHEPLTPLAHQYLEALRRGERQVASRMILQAVDEGTSVRDIYLHVFEPTQREIGRLWQINRISVAEEHYCTAATQLIMSQLYPHIFAQEKKEATLVATCVSGDLHELGVRMVADFFEMDGWHTFYLGANTPHASVIDTLVERRADVLAVSATLSYHVQAVRDLIRAVRQNERCGRVKILVGGYPFIRNPDLWREIGADGSAVNAQQAIELANRMTGKLAS